MAEVDMNRKIRHWRMENRRLLRLVLTITPTDFLEPIRAHIETGDYRP